MNTTMRHLQGEEILKILYPLASYSLHPSPPYQDKEEWEAIVRERQGMVCQALFEGETPVSIAISTPMTQNMRGKLYPASGVWGVATHPSARRKGYCREVIASVLSMEREGGKVFSNLYPFRESFYERLGYVSYPITKIARLSPTSLSPLLKMNLVGEIRQQYFGETFDSYRDYLTKMRTHTHGMALFDFIARGQINKNLFWTALAVIDGKIEGLMVYRILGEEVTKYLFSAIRFYYSSSRARHLLLAWIARHIDQVDRVEIWIPADEYPETWLADINVKIESTVRAAMSRVLEVGKIGGMDSAEGCFSVRIFDPLCKWNEGIWRFESHEGKLRISRASKADCELTIQGLTALIAGIHSPQDIPLRGWGDVDPTIQSIQADMFPRAVPYMHEIF